MKNVLMLAIGAVGMVALAPISDAAETKGLIADQIRICFPNGRLPEVKPAECILTPHPLGEESHAGGGVEKLRLNWSKNVKTPRGTPDTPDDDDDEDDCKGKKCGGNDDHGGGHGGGHDDDDNDDDNNDDDDNDDDDNEGGCKGKGGGNCGIGNGGGGGNGTGNEGNGNGPKGKGRKNK